MIVVYTRATCAYCPGVKKYLQMKGVEYEERDGDPTDATYQAYASKYGSTVPLVIDTETEDGVVGNRGGILKIGYICCQMGAYIDRARWVGGALRGGCVIVMRVGGVVGGGSAVGYYRLPPANFFQNTLFAFSSFYCIIYPTPPQPACAILDLWKHCSIPRHTKHHELNLWVSTLH